MKKFVPAILGTVKSSLNSSNLRKVLNTLLIRLLKARPLIHLLIYAMRIGWTHLKKAGIWVVRCSGTHSLYPGPLSLPLSGLKLKYYFCCVDGRVISDNWKNATVRVSFIFITSTHFKMYDFTSSESPVHHQQAVWAGRPQSHTGMAWRARVGWHPRWQL